MITEEKIIAIIDHCKREKEHSISPLIRKEHSDVLECLEELLELRKVNPLKSKLRCLRDKSKKCDLCHECDIDVSNPHSSLY